MKTNFLTWLAPWILATTIHGVAAPPEHLGETGKQVTAKQGETVLGQRIVSREPGQRREPVDWVDCLVGTSTSRWMLYPGPSMPFGMVKLSPDNQGDDPAERHWKAGYEYTIGNLMGFNPFFPPSGPARRLVQGPPVRSKLLAAPQLFVIWSRVCSRRAESASTFSGCLAERLA